jgi:hypothetical protein
MLVSLEIKLLDFLYSEWGDICYKWKIDKVHQGVYADNTVVIVQL